MELLPVYFAFSGTCAHTPSKKQNKPMCFKHICSCLAEYSAYTDYKSLFCLRLLIQEMLWQSLSTQVCLTGLWMRSISHLQRANSLRGDP